LIGYRAGRVAADPAPVPEAAVPGAWPALTYFRLHGSPRKYWSNYEGAFLEALAETVRGLTDAEEVWCVFDNTASGAALDNACDLRDRLGETQRNPVGP
jgi:uncharacterized protein YecE (DUF72 family)